MKKRATILLLAGVVILLLSFLLKKADNYTSTNEYCNSCHVHDHAHASWMESVHYNTAPHLKKTRCVDCHLPPKGQAYYKEKLKAGVRDLYAFHFKDSSEYNWSAKSQIEHASLHTFKESCIRCHPKLFPVKLSENGEMAHWHYTRNKEEMHCIQCHINIGHGNEAKATHNRSFLRDNSGVDTTYAEAATINTFSSYTETIPGSDVAFRMIAVKGGAHHLQKDTFINNFFIGEIEVSWNEYFLFLSETEAEGRHENQELDGISGATPPWGNPDQGWGFGKRPAITMTHHAALTYCRWLSLKTGKNYRLPTSLEWEFAATKAIRDTDINNQIANTNNTHTIEPGSIQADQLGTKHLFGNVKEFCSDAAGNNEFIIKGGSFKSDINELSPQLSETTQHKQWLKTDPQIPKSIWWYSDCNDVGFRVVLSYQPEQKN
ncbi:NapC/NirT family cytochrome c [Carboxylicivirga sp. RSCT41]|uniref:NapC/NirT family cytochrome c n=1 Tax=Carboxylicivirga agarovorans TaxID=3417570 RepID=UPI003D3593E6